MSIRQPRKVVGRPRQLARLFSVEMWERFGFYGMRALLVLYLVKHFLLQQYQASGIVGGYLSLGLSHSGDRRLACRLLSGPSAR